VRQVTMPGAIISATCIIQVIRLFVLPARTEKTIANQGSSIGRLRLLCVLVFSFWRQHQSTALASQLCLTPLGRQQRSLSFNDACFPPPGNPGCQNSYGLGAVLGR
jgi:hypothetical protein